MNQAIKGSGAIGSATVSKTVGCGFESRLPCKSETCAGPGTGRNRGFDGSSKTASEETILAPNEGAASVEADAKTTKNGFWSRIVQFVRQVIAELKKVVWPTRDELTTFFVVVIVFVLAMMVFSGVVDVITAWLVTKVFGG